MIDKHSFYADLETYYIQFEKEKKSENNGIDCG